MRSIDEASGQVLFEQRIFSLIFISTIRQIFCLPPLLLMRTWCQIVPLWIPFEHSNFSFRLKPHSPKILQDLNFDYNIYWCNIRPSMSCPCITCLQTISCFLRLTVFSPSATTFSLRSLSTNRKFPHSQKASRNDFRGPLWQAISLPSRVSLARPVLSCAHLMLPSA